jgi:hypothetical protein
MDPTYDERPGARDSSWGPRPGSGSGSDSTREPLNRPMREIDRPMDPLNRRDGSGGSDPYRSDKPESPVPQRNPNEEGSRLRAPGPVASRALLVSAPAKPMSLDNKVTWRSAPERTRMKVRSTFATPVVARSTIDSNSDWAPVAGATKIVSK